MAKLTTENIVVSEGIEHIIYKREKTKNVKNMKPLIIPVTPALKDILEWFKQNTSLVGNYLLPIRIMTESNCMTIYVPVINALIIT